MRAVMCVDVEPDSRTPDPTLPVEWFGAGRVLDDRDWLRQQLDGGAVNWFLRLDHQIEHLHGARHWPAEHFGHALSAVIADGDEVGTHPHNWRWTGDRWLADGADSWAVHNTACSIEAYTEVFGHGPASFRFGDRFVSDDVLRLLLDHPDVRVDLTTEPGVRACRGLVPSENASGITRHVDVALSRRYRPDGGAADISSDSGSLTMVPLTTAIVPGTGSVDTVILWRAPEEFERMLRMRLLDRQLDHLAFAIRSDLVLLPWAMEHVEANLATLSSCVPDLEWVRASTLALHTDEPSDQGLGLLGSLANELDEVIRTVYTGPPATVPSLAETVRSIAERCEALAEDEAKRSRELADAALQLRNERARVVELTDVSGAERRRADELRDQLDAIERTVSWRLRTMALPALRPMAQARRWIARRWRSLRSGH